MMTGILVAGPNEMIVGNAISTLQAIVGAKIESVEDFGTARLPQVHALNCLKDIFTNTRLGIATEKHLATTLTIAVRCLESDM